ncbi:MAG: glycosyltransferase family 2 protein [Bacteroidetes bacterium]|nr:glycosyltransferase family 2 protein [Bacteroidota bacterium]
MISVCIPTYNGEKFIFQQLQSILSQLQQDDEVVISDDSSTDNTIHIIKSFNDHRIVLLGNNKFYSPIFNLENALKHAKGDYIFLSDQDDIWEQNKVITFLNHLKSFELVVSDCKIIDKNGNLLKKSLFERTKPTYNFFTCLYRNPFLGNAMAFNRTIMNKALPFPKKIIMHDIWIGLLALKTAKIYFIEEKLSSWRRHEQNVTNSIQKSDDKLSEYSFFFKIKYRFIMLVLIFKRVIFKS